jgi:hypothetical protein
MCSARENEGAKRSKKKKNTLSKETTDFHCASWKIDRGRVTMMRDEAAVKVATVVYSHFKIL